MKLVRVNGTHTFTSVTRLRACTRDKVFNFLSNLIETVPSEAVWYTYTYTRTAAISQYALRKAPGLLFTKSLKKN